MRNDGEIVYTEIVYTEVYLLVLCLWGFNMGKLKLFQIPCGQYLDRTLGKESVAQNLS